jgi:hypothetical protein
MAVFLIILAVVVVIIIIKSLTKKAVVNSLNWEKPILLGNDVQVNTDFRQIILDDMNSKISKGAIVIKEGNEIPGYLSVDGRNSIYSNTSPRYQVGQVYSTSARSGANSYFIVYIWIDKGITYDAPYEIKYH